MAFGILSFCQVMNAQICDGVTAQAVPMVPQDPTWDYYGVRVTLSKTASTEVSVQGYIHDEASISSGYPFHVTISPGSTEAQTGTGDFHFERSTNVTVTVASVYPCPSDQLDYDAFDSRFNSIGAFHNQFLANVVSSYNVPQNINNYEGAINNIRDFNKAFYIVNEVSYFGSAQSSQDTDEGFEKVKYYANWNEFVNKLLSTNDPISLDSCLIKINSVSTIDNSNRQLLSNIADAIRANLNGFSSNTDFEQALVNLTNSWIQMNANNEQSDGARLTGSILAIGLKSCQWWDQNLAQLNDGNLAMGLYDSPIWISGGPSVYNERRYYLVPVVANDVAGAFVGAIGSAVGQYAVNGHVNMRGVYWGALSGAVLGSVGVVGKVGKWLSSLF